MVMIRVNVHEAKANLSRYLAKLKPGEVIVVCRRNVPVAEIRALGKEPVRARPWGLYRGQIRMAADFDAPLPDEELRAWEGGE